MFMLVLRLFPLLPVTAVCCQGAPVFSPVWLISLRDTFAVELLVAGVPLEEVSKLLGHDSIKTTERHYAPWVKRRQDHLDAQVSATWAGPSAQK